MRQELSMNYRHFLALSRWRITILKFLIFLTLMDYQTKRRNSKALRL